MPKSASANVCLLKRVDTKKFSRFCVGCLVLSQDNKIVLQRRDDDCPTFPGALATFGGGIEQGETPIQALVRELKEELGADVKASDVVNLGALTEAETNFNELVYVYFWHDKQGTITGCYEGKAKYYNDPAEVIKHRKVMNDVCWLLQECKKMKLLK
jgi:8-oxo-dGTP diphosphatase